MITMKDSIPDNPVEWGSYPLYYNKINNNMAGKLLSDFITFKYILEEKKK